MQPQINKKGYRRINLWKNNKAHQFLVGTLVAEHFLEKNDPDLVVIHIGEKLNDSVENLKFVTRSEAVHISHFKPNQKRQIDYDFNSKEYRHLIKIAKKNGITQSQLRNRLYNKWTAEEATTIPTQRTEKMLRKTLYEYEGKLLSVKQLSKLSGHSEGLLYKRLARGWTVEEAINVPNLQTGIKRKKGDK